jgi:hypothetical protein
MLVTSLKDAPFIKSFSFATFEDFIPDILDFCMSRRRRRQICVSSFAGLLQLNDDLYRRSGGFQFSLSN